MPTFVVRRVLHVPVSVGVRGYARVEWERRFLARALPAGEVTREVAIVDRYLHGTRVRLRTMTSRDSVVYKLTQKIPAESGAGPGMITTMYLDDREHARFAELAASVIEKTRYSIPPFGIDVFAAPLAGLVLAEAEFDDGDEMRRLAIPPWAIAEVTDDLRFTGGALAARTPDEIDAVLRTFGVGLAGRAASDPCAR